MNERITILVLMLVLGCVQLSAAQSLDGRPYTPGVDADIDLYMHRWQASPERIVRGELTEREVLMSGDPVTPSEPGAVLKYVNRFVYATLPAGQSTDETTLRGAQEVYVIVSGTGIMNAGRTRAGLKSGIFVLVPEGQSFAIENTCSEPLVMYIIEEPTYEGFEPLDDLLVVDENRLPISGSNGHWSHIVKRSIEKPNGLATIKSVLTVRSAPMTIGRPHSHDPGCEEVWTALDDTSLLFLGKQIRTQPPGTAYNIPPDGKTPHCNVNTSDGLVKFLYFSVRKDLEE